MQTTLRRLTVAWLVVILLLVPAVVGAQAAVQAWVQRYNGPGNGYDKATAVAVDGSNNVVVTGYSPGGGGLDDYATIKYSSSGVPLWTNRYNGPGNMNDYAKAVAVDSSNNVIVTGYSSGGFSGDDYTTIKYSATGVPLWTKHFNGSSIGMDQAYAVVVDRNNDVIVTGDSSGWFSGDDYATVKYSSGGVLLWTNRYNGPGSNTDEARAVLVDGNNAVIVAGSSYGSGSDSDFATVKYSSGGVPLWTNRYNGPGNSTDWAFAAAVDHSNNVVVTGCSYGSGRTYSDYATVKYTSAGVGLWTNFYNGPGNNDDQACAVAVDASNNVIVAGWSYGIIDYGSFQLSSPRYATIKYSSTGVPLWTNRHDVIEGQAFATAVAVDGSDNVTVTGYSTGPGGYYDYVTIRYSGAGVPLWTNRYTGPGNGYHQASGLAVDRSGNVIVTGVSAGSGTDSDFATVKYASAIPRPIMTGLKVTNGTFQMRVDNVLQTGTLVVEACTNLVEWRPVFTNTVPTNVVFYTDPGAGNYRRRFYRAFQFY